MTSLINESKMSLSINKVRFALISLIRLYSVRSSKRKNSILCNSSTITTDQVSIRFLYHHDVNSTLERSRTNTDSRTRLIFDRSTMAFLQCTGYSFLHESIRFIRHDVEQSKTDTDSRTRLFSSEGQWHSF